MTSQFSWDAVVAQIVATNTATVAKQNAEAVSAYDYKYKNWIEVNSLTRDRLQNVNFVPEPIPVIPHKKGVDKTTGAILDLGPFPDLKPPVLPPYDEPKSGGPIAAPSVDKLDLIGQMLQRLLIDVAAIRAAMKE